jgi:hypothetical protein
LDNVVDDDANLLTVGGEFLESVMNREIANRPCRAGTVPLDMLLEAIDVPLEKKISRTFGTVALLMRDCPV